ncbi:MAG: HD domain-containing phosphohydrolase [Planctomycetota bacterium]
MVRFSDIFKKLKQFESKDTSPAVSQGQVELKNASIKPPVSDLSFSHALSEERTESAIPPALNARIINVRAGISAPEQPAAGKTVSELPPARPNDAYLGVHFALAGGKGNTEEKRVNVAEPPPDESGQPQTPSSFPYSLAAIIGAAIDGPGAEQSAPGPLNISGIIKAQETQEIQKALELYDNLIAFSQIILEQVDKKKSLKSINLKGLTGVIQEMVSLITNGDRGLLDLIYRSSKDNYLIAHLVNTCIISLEIGKGLGYNPSRLADIGLSAFLHDVGMQEVFPLIYRQDKLSRDEYDRVKMHVIAGVNLLKEVENLPPEVLEVCAQHHERITGGGYRSLGGAMISEYAKIIGLADTFEAITHSRPHRRQKSGQAAIKDLIENSGDSFDRKALKVLVKRIGIYPVGTWVALNTGEIARVVRVNETFPIRPIVTIMMLADKSTPIETKTIDLAKNQNVYIRTTLDEEEIIGKMPK